MSWKFNVTSILPYQRTNFQLLYLKKQNLWQSLTRQIDNKVDGVWGPVSADAMGPPPNNLTYLYKKDTEWVQCFIDSTVDIVPIGIVNTDLMFKRNFDKSAFLWGPRGTVATVASGWKLYPNMVQAAVFLASGQVMSVDFLHYLDLWEILQCPFFDPADWVVSALLEPVDRI